MTDAAFFDDHPADRVYPPGPVPEAELWRTARSLFEDGVPGADVCAALKLAPSTFWKRAEREGWLRRDTPAAVPAPAPVEVDPPAYDLETALGLAWSRVCRALDAGHPGHASHWMRVYDRIAASVAAQRRARAADERRLAQSPQVDAPKASASNSDAVDGGPARPVTRVRMEKVESNSGDSTQPTPGPALNRAERRRRMKMGRAPP